jgi:hypothetical protein
VDKFRAGERLHLQPPAHTPTVLEHSFRLVAIPVPEVEPGELAPTHPSPPLRESGEEPGRHKIDREEGTYRTERSALQHHLEE